MRINLGWLFTETTKEQKAVLAMLLIAILEIVNMCTLKYNSGVFELVLIVIAGLGGYSVAKTRSKKDIVQQ